MKRFLSVFIVLILSLLFLCSCSNKPNVQYVRVSWNDGMNEKHQLFSNRQQLDDFINNYEYRDDDFKKYSNVMRNHLGEPTSFALAIEKYDDNYFQNNALVLISLEQGSGSIYHKVKSCEVMDYSIIINMETYIPSDCTDDMALWHILIELEAGDYFAKKITLNNTIKIQNRLGLWSIQKR